jgi:hypothetical protein
MEKDINSISTVPFVWLIQPLSELFAGRGARALSSFKYPPMSTTHPTTTISTQPHA